MRVLMIAFHFPPLAGSSGIQRTLRFVQHLPDCGWQPLVLTANARAYERTSGDLEASVPSNVPVVRAFALDAARHLAIAGRYPQVFACPDRWVSWRFDAVRQGMRMIARWRPQVIWSTYPIATAHAIAAELQGRSGLPWVADFRDPMAQDGYPEDPRIWRSYKSIERRAVMSAARSVFTSPGAIAEYRRVYPTQEDRFLLMENGYDEAAFERASSRPSRLPSEGRLQVLHSGLVYPSERDPTHFVRAIASLRRSGRINAAEVEFRFRASGADSLLNRLAMEEGVEDLISLCPPLPYEEALAEMLCADGLLLMQAANCNAQIPAKAYEYLRAHRPILCLTDPGGDTADLLRRASAAQFMAPLDSASDIAEVIARFVTSIRTGAAATGEATFVAECSRQARSRELALVLDAVARP